MNSRKQHRWLRMGIRNRLLLFTLPLVLIPLLLVVLINSYVFNRYIESVIMERLEYSNLKISENFNRLVGRLDEYTRRIILDQSVQRSLVEETLSQSTRLEIERLLWTFVLGDIRSALYMDNKGNLMYAQKYDSTTQEAITSSAIFNRLANTYGELKIGFGPDEILGKTGNYLFAARNIRRLELNIPKGVTILWIGQEAIEQVFTPALMVDGGVYLLVDQDDNIVYDSSKTHAAGDPASMILDMNFSKNNESRVEGTGTSLRIVSSYQDPDSGWRIVTIVPRRAVFADYMRAQSLTYGIILIAALVSVILVILLAYRFIRPVTSLTKAMRDFKGGRFNTRLPVAGPDEIGEASDSFNRMADEIIDLIGTVNRKQQQLRESELKSLVYQINPHFIYNTLDNIHMMARMSGNKDLSRLILALSRLLRISLSKGFLFIKLSDEFEHAESYLQIQMIRFAGLFTYRVELENGIGDLAISKFILQPLVENSIKHGFSKMTEGGLIIIRGWQDDGWVHMSVQDNGTGIDDATLNTLNRMTAMAAEEMHTAFPRSTSGYGVANVIARLQMTYEYDFTLRFESDGSGMICRLSIRFDRMNDSLLSRRDEYRV